MRRQDIKVGVPYAYREGTWGSYRKCVFLLPATRETLYTTSRWKNAGYIRDTYRDAPHGYNGYTPATGWLAAIGDNAEQGSLQEALEHGQQMAEDGLPVGHAESTYQYKLVTSMAHVHGEYDTLVKAAEDAEALRIKREQERKDSGREQQAIWVPLRDSLREYLDGKVDLTNNGHLWEESAYNIDGSSHPNHLRLDKEATESVLCLINDLSDTLSRVADELIRLDDENTELRNRVHHLEP